MSNGDPQDTVLEVLEWWFPGPHPPRALFRVLSGPGAGRLWPWWAERETVPMWLDLTRSTGPVRPGDRLVRTTWHRPLPGGRAYPEEKWRRPEPDGAVGGPPPQG